jgi:hypothetical protein
MPANLTITADVSGLAGLGASVHRQLVAVLDSAAQEVLTHAADSITGGSKTGRIYGEHQSSAPGEAPANDEGVLAGSMFIERTSDLVRHVIAPAEYAAALEFGTLDGRIAPRPFLGPALEAVKPGFVADVAEVVKRAGG